MLSPRQREALTVLQRLGATDLTAEFSAHDLRKAFRGLALRYHPDRHPGAALLEHARMAAAFSEASAAYRVLSALVSPLQ